MAPTTKTYDAIVVGTGAAGGWAAKELTEGGMKVLALEAGPPIDKVKDFPPNLEPVEMNMWARVGFALRGQHIQAKMTGTFGGGFSRFYVNDRENPYSNPSDAPFSWFRSRQGGGRMHTWARVPLRMAGSDFQRPTPD